MGFNAAFKRGAWQLSSGILPALLQQSKEQNRAELIDFNSIILL
jgi:hypothetical protein